MIETSEPCPHGRIEAVRLAKLFVFLRLHRYELFDEPFQAELAQAYADSPKGQPPVPPARLALAVVLQAYTEASDNEVIEATVMDRRWQLVLDCMNGEEPPFSKGTLVRFRMRLIERDLDRPLVERTVELAEATDGFGARAPRRSRPRGSASTRSRKPPDQREPSLRSSKENPGACGTPGSPGPPAGPLSYPDAKIAAVNGASRPSAPAINPDE